MAEEQQTQDASSAPKLVAEIMPQRRVMMTLSMKIASMLIVDVRESDYQGGAIRGSLNIPAKNLALSQLVLYELAYKSDMEWVVFTCSSSKGRGPRCAAAFLDHVRNFAGDNDMQVMVLEDGIKGWVKAGPHFTRLMDGYDEGYWKEVFAEAEKEK